jgi:hypothetical protein
MNLGEQTNFTVKITVKTSQSESELLLNQLN